MNETKPSRREFLTATPLLLAAAPFGLPKEPAEVPSNGALTCRWVQVYGAWHLWVGRDQDMEVMPNGYGASLEGVLWRHSHSVADTWTFRFGRFFVSFGPCDLADAQKQSVRHLHEWLRELSVEVERMAFAVR